MAHFPQRSDAWDSSVLTGVRLVSQRRSHGWNVPSVLPRDVTVGLTISMVEDRFISADGAASGMESSEEVDGDWIRKVCDTSSPICAMLNRKRFRSRFNIETNDTNPSGDDMRRKADEFFAMTINMPDSQNRTVLIFEIAKAECTGDPHLYGVFLSIRRWTRNILARLSAAMAITLSACTFRVELQRRSHQSWSLASTGSLPV